MYWEIFVLVGNWILVIKIDFQMAIHENGLANVSFSQELGKVIQDCSSCKHKKELYSEEHIVPI